MTLINRQGTKNLPYDEVHFEDGSSLYKNGTWRHSGSNKKEYHINKEQRKFLEDNGWTVPKQN